ncbi:MAG: hypothetical protein WDO73_10800 [Ignavibacteriota bacterium]
MSVPVARTCWSDGCSISRRCLPVIGIVQVGLQAHADRYTYVPLIGLSIILAWGAAELGRGRERLVGALAIVAVVGWAAAARSYLDAWHDSASLFQHALALHIRQLRRA